MKLGIEDLLAVVSCVALPLIIPRLWLFIQQLLLNSQLYLRMTSKQDRLKAYGPCALITGGTSGIGLEFAHQLIKEGFKIINISRDAEKLEFVKSELLKISQGSCIINVVADLAQVQDQKFYDRLAKMMERENVGLLVNNVGVGVSGINMYNISVKEMHRMINVNCLTPATISKIFYQHVENQRSKRKSGYIELSSIAASRPFPGRELYASSKAFNREWGHYISSHSKHIGLDVLVLRPGFVKTPLIGNREIDLITVLPSETVTSALDSLGRVSETYGPVKHILFCSMIEVLLWVIPPFIFANLKIFLYKLVRYNNGMKGVDTTKKDN